MAGDPRYEQLEDRVEMLETAVWGSARVPGTRERSYEMRLENMEDVIERVNREHAAESKFRKQIRKALWAAVLALATAASANMKSVMDSFLKPVVATTTQPGGHHESHSNH